MSIRASAHCCASSPVCPPCSRWRAAGRPTARTASSFTIVSPYVKAEAKPGPHKFDIGFRIDDGRYHSSPADSYTDYSLIGNGDMVFSGRAGLKMRAEHRHGHDPRGSTDRAGSATPDEYDNTGIDGVFRYGAPGARGRIEVDAGAYRRTYTNNRVTTSGSDRDTTQQTRVKISELLGMMLEKLR